MVPKEQNGLNAKPDTVDVCKAGLHVDVQYPYMGASPDGIINCECCGKGVLEIKCPFCVKNETIDDATNNKTFCLIKGNTTHLDPQAPVLFSGPDTDYFNNK